MKVKELETERKEYEVSKKKKLVFQKVTEIKLSVEAKRKEVEKLEKQLNDFLEKDFEKISLKEVYHFFGGNSVEIDEEE